MPNKKTKPLTGLNLPDGAAEYFAGLTWFDLERWAGGAIVDRGRDYHRRGLVADLARTPGGGLLAWVRGTRRYAVSVEYRDGTLFSRCTCPYDGACKHAVATILAFLDDIRHARPTPAAPEDDERLAKVSADEGLSPFQEPGGEAAADIPDDILSPALRKAVADWLQELPKEQAVALLGDLAAEFPAVRRTLAHRAALAGGDWRVLSAAALREITALKEMLWDEDEDGGEGPDPDPGRIPPLLIGLLEAGRADEVLALGRKILTAGIDLIEHGVDWISVRIASCLEVALDALPQSSLPPDRQMLWLAELELEDDYSLLPDTSRFWSLRHPAAAWSRFADELAKRLRDAPVVKEQDYFSFAYERDRISDKVMAAMEKAGRTDEIIPLCEREAELTGSYVRLVERLAAAGDWAGAEKWIQKGLAALKGKWPGVAARLREIRLEHAVFSQDWPRAAWLSACDFFREPSAAAFAELRQAAKRIRAWPAVREAAIHFLKDGTLPQAGGGEAIEAKEWPLAPIDPGEIDQQRPPRFPLAETLIDIAVAEKNPAEALFWYDSLAQRSPSRRLSERVADAVASSHPDRALAIWKRLADQLIAVTQPRAYLDAAEYLRRIRSVMHETAREQEWQEYLAGLKKVNARKKRLIEILGRLEERPIVRR